MERGVEVGGVKGVLLVLYQLCVSCIVCAQSIGGEHGVRGEGGRGGKAWEASTTTGHIILGGRLMLSTLEVNNGCLEDFTLQAPIVYHT